MANPAGKHRSAQQTKGASQADGRGRAEPAGQRAREQRADRGHTHEHHRVHGHYPSPEGVGSHRLDQGIRGCHLSHHGEARGQQEQYSQPELPHERERDHAQAEGDGRPTDAPAVALEPNPSSEAQGADQSTYTRRTHQNAQPSRSGVERLVGNDGHQHRIGGSHEADQSQQQKQC